MNSSRSWFRSGSYTLPRTIDIPHTGQQRLGVVIIPPFGWEDVCSYRPLRFLGRALAANGIPALRFDLPGTGDSSGSALDSGLVAAWIQSIADAVAELRAAVGVENVAAVGIGLGAMLAITAAARGTDLQDLVLWGAAPTGRALVRELRVFSKMEIEEFANDAPRPQTVPGLEVAGFLISPETQKDLESLDLLALPRMHGRRIMVLSRNDFLPDVRLVNALEKSGCVLEVRAGSGYAAMMAVPHDAVPPTATGRVIVEFLNRDGEVKPEEPAGNPVIKSVVAECAGRLTAAMEEGGSGVLETIHTFRRSSSSIFGMLSEPAAEASGCDLCLLFLNPGAVRHIGSNRMWVEAARRWAARGVTSVRMDFTGIGESDGEPLRDIAGLYQPELMGDIEAAMSASRSRLGARQFILIGLCSGAFWAFHAAVRYPEVRGAILLNPRQLFWDPDLDRRRVLRRTVNGFTDLNSWRRLVLGKITPQRIRQAGQNLVDSFRESRAASGWRPQIPNEMMARSLAAVEHNQSRLTFVFTEGEPLLLEMEEEGQLPPENNSRIRCIRVANCGHTFRPLWAQKLIHTIIDRELDVVLRESPQFLKRHSAKSSG
jgi:pimeloyl-ACP methyl ester carboxylesterase